MWVIALCGVVFFGIAAVFTVRFLKRKLEEKLVLRDQRYHEWIDEIRRQFPKMNHQARNGGGLLAPRIGEEAVSLVDAPELALGSMLDYFPDAPFDAERS